jgi:Fe-S cluster assembly protein SufD
MAPPGTDEEVWRYSRVDEIDLDTYRLPVGDGGDPEPVKLLAASVPDPALVVLVRDGAVVGVTSSPEADAAGVVARATADGDEEVLGAAEGEPSDLFTTLNRAYSTPVVIDIPRGASLTAPVVIAHWTSGTGVVSFPRLLVRAAEDSQAQIVELQGAADAPLIVPITELVVGRAARLSYLAVQRLPATAWQVATLVGRADADATLRIGAASFGGGYARLRTDCRLVGRGASGELLAAYFADGDQTLDFRTFQEHAAPDTHSELVFKGAGAGTSRSVYTGLIRVAKEARGTNAFQTNRNLKLSPEAWAESVPNLVIENNDVHCSHASAVGPIDPEHRFYLESRGVPPQEADRLIVTGFFDELVARLPVAALAPAIGAEIQAKLDRSDI